MLKFSSEEQVALSKIGASSVYSRKELEEAFVLIGKDIRSLEAFISVCQECGINLFMFIEAVNEMREQYS